MILFKKADEAHRELLFSVNQKYLYEMTNFYPDDMDENGNYGYGHFEEYFTDPNRSAYFIYEGSVLVGFFMLNPYSYIGGNPDNVIAEFCIFPSYRRRHIAKTAARMIFDMRPGKWEIKYNNKNIPAKNLWENATSQYNPVRHDLGEEGTVLEFINRI